MRTRPAALIKAWWAKYRRWIVALLVIYLLVMLALFLLTGGARMTPFQYQIF
jgi:ABC-type antimicrobial peptide transport system permease subunit